MCLNVFVNYRLLVKYLLAISIGIGENTGSVKDVSERARAALDIALGRGGDQVCIMDGESTRFFGGNTAGVEKIRAFVLVWLVKPFMN